MPTWSVTARTDRTVDFGGTPIRLRAGETWQTESACDCLLFLQGLPGPLHEDTATVAEVREACAAERRAAGLPPPSDAPSAGMPQPPTSVTDDSADAPPVEPDTGDQQGAPTVPTVGAIGDQAPDPPAKVAPEDEPRAQPEAQPDPARAGERSRQPAEGGDPVELFSGLLSLRVIDLEVPTAVLPLQLVRTYRSGGPSFGPLGFNWDHSYNVYVRPLEDGDVARWTGALREDRFVLRGDGEYDPPPGVFERLERLPGPADRFLLVLPGGEEHTFERPAGYVDAQRIPLVAVADRHGNRQELRYDARDRLAEVVDGEGRALRFTYGERDLLDALSDHTGRVVRYCYHPEIEHLIAAVAPPTTDFPDGEDTLYEYAYPHPLAELRHNIVRIAQHGGRVLLENDYVEQPGSFGFNRIRRQRYADDVYEYEYRSIQYTPPGEQFLNLPFSRTEVREPDGGLTAFTFNYRGDLLDLRQRLVRDRSFRVTFERYGYDEQGNRTIVEHADGNRSELTYDAANADPCARGNLLRIELFPSAAFPVPSRVVWRGRYEPSFQLLREGIVEGGHATGYEYDFDVAPGPSATGKLVRIRYPAATLPDGSVQVAERRFEHNARGQVTAEVSPAGVRRELTYFGAGPHAGRLEAVADDATGAPIAERLTYDAFGFVATVTDGTWATRRFLRNARGQLERYEQPDVAGSTAGVRLGYGIGDKLVRIERPAGELDDGVVAAGGTIVDELRRDERGRLVEFVLGANSASPRRFTFCYDHADRILAFTDPTEVRLERVYDERGLLLEESTRAGTVRGPTVRWRYDRVGRPTETILADGQRARQVPDAFGRPARMIRPDGAEQRLAYGDADVIAAREVRGDPGDGVARLLARVRHEHDERGRERRRFLLAFDEDPAAGVELETTFEHDPDDRLLTVTDHRGAVSSAGYSGERLVRLVDPVGNRVEWEYDGAGRETAMTRTGLEGGVPRSRRWELRYDARGRLARRVEPDGTDERYEHDDRDLVVAVVGTGGVRERRSYGLLAELLRREVDPARLAIADSRGYDDAGRVLTYTDPLDEVTLQQRDALGRHVATRFADGTTFTRAFGPDGRVRAETTPNGVTVAYAFDAAGRCAALTATGGAGIDPVPDHAFAYDGLDRLVRAGTGPAVVERRYDSLNRLHRETADGVQIADRYDDLAGTVERSFPDGRREVSHLDLLGRVERITETAPGALGGHGPELLRVGWTGLGQWETLTLPGGIVGRARYDDRRRLTELVWERGGQRVESARYRLDAASRRRVELVAGPPALTRRTRLDSAHRLTGVEEGFPAPALGAAAAQADHDVDIAAAEAAGAASATVAHTLSPGDDRLSEARSGAPPIALAYGRGHRLAAIGGAPVTFHADGHRRADPGRSYDIDALGRLVRVRGPGGTLLAGCGYDPLGRLATVEEDGATRRLRYFADRPVQEDRGGAAFRQWTEHPTLAVPLLAHRAGALQSCLLGATVERLAVLDHTGVPVARYRYEPFGAPQAFDGAGTGPLPAGAAVEEPMFGAMPYLGAAGLYWTPFRAMDPGTGLFLARDPRPFLDSPSPYVYAAHDPLDLIDPDGDLAFLVVLAVVAIGGALLGGGVSAARQGIGIWTGERTEPFSWGEVLKGSLFGAVLAPAIVVAPELVLPLAAAGVGSAINEARQGNWATAGFDAVLAVAPFKFSSVRSSVFGQGSLVGGLRGLGPVEGWSGRLARFEVPAGVRPPGVEVRRIEYEGVPAWEKTVYTRIPGLRQWAELSIRSQVRGLKKLQDGEVPAARVLQEYERGGALVVEDVGPQASEALRADPALRAAYNAYFREAARALGWQHLGRIPGLRQFLHDLRPDNIGYTSEGSFRAFDPSLDPVTQTLAIGGAVAAIVVPTAAQAEPERRPEPPRRPGAEGRPAPAGGDASAGKP